MRTSLLSLVRGASSKSDSQLRCSSVSSWHCASAVMDAVGMTCIHRCMSDGAVL